MLPDGVRETLKISIHGFKICRAIFCFPLVLPGQRTSEGKSRPRGRLKICRRTCDGPLNTCAGQIILGVMVGGRKSGGGRDRFGTRGSDKVRTAGRNFVTKGERGWSILIRFGTCITEEKTEFSRKKKIIFPPVIEKFHNFCKISNILK
jgi:hypothetical protein